jgi:recombination protein RecR
MNISDTETCQICANPKRNERMVCVVENIRDVMSVENTNQYTGLYHVLGGIISPIDGIGPADLTIDSLEKRVEAGGIDEVILALSTTMEGDTTNFYIYKRLKSYPVKISTIARGVAIGDELEYADEITLGRSIVDRTPFESTFSGRKQDNPE